MYQNSPLRQAVIWVLSIVIFNVISYLLGWHLYISIIGSIVISVIISGIMYLLNRL